VIRRRGTTAAVIALNEETHIEECLDALRWAEECLVVDGGSADRTVSKAAGTARVLQRPFDTFARQRNFALDKVNTEWVLFVDADERVSPALAAEVQEVVDRGAQAPQAAGGGADVAASSKLPAGYWVPRKNLMLGRWVRHAGWWPDYQMRLFRRDFGRYDEGRDPHELVTLGGHAGYLREPLLHYNYGTVGEMFARQELYARREAAGLLAQGIQPVARRVAVRPLREFWRRYITLKGYREGGLGMLLAVLMAWYEYRVQVHLMRAYG